MTLRYTEVTMRYVPDDDEVMSDEDSRAGWLTAYRRFLMSRDESMALKLAPLVLVGILPPELMSNLIPGLGLLDDYSFLLFGVFVMYKTVKQVQHYRY